MFGFAFKNAVVEDPLPPQTLQELVALIADGIPAAAARAKSFLVDVDVVEYKVQILSSLLLLVALLLCLNKRTSSMAPEIRTKEKMVGEDATEHTLELAASSSASGSSRDSDGSVSSVEHGGGDSIDDDSVEETYSEFLSKLVLEENGDTKDTPIIDHIPLANSDSKAEDRSCVTHEDEVSDALDDTVPETPTATSSTSLGKSTAPDKALDTQDAMVLETPSDTSATSQGTAALLSKLGLEESVPKVAASGDAKDTPTIDHIPLASSDSETEDRSCVTQEDEVSDALDDTVPETPTATSTTSQQGTVALGKSTVPDKSSDTQDATVVSETPSDTSVTHRIGGVVDAPNALAESTSPPPALEGAVASSPKRASVKKQLSVKRQSMKRNLSKIFK